MKPKQELKIGFIGQGFIGKNYADDFENRGYEVVRYALEEPYKENKNRIKECDIVFIAVPTPTTPDGFNTSILKEVIKNVGAKKSAVIKSTIAVGVTKEIQKENPNIFVFHSPEFLTEATASENAAKPERNIIGIPVTSKEYGKKAQFILSTLPKAPFELVCDSNEAELIKYGGNNWFFFKVVFINMFYDLVRENGASWDVIQKALSADPRIGSSHLTPVHKSGTIGGDSYHLNPKMNKDGERGAGGHCFIKDYAAFVEMYKKYVGDEPGIKALESLEQKNIDLLLSSNKDIGLLKGVYGKDITGDSK